VRKSAASGLKVSYELIDGLKPFPRNSRTHSKKQTQQIADSIKAFGFTNPVLIDSENRIVAGSGRVAAARLLGMDQVPAIRLEALNHDQVRAYAISDNRLAQKAGWDKEALAIELQHLTAVDLDFDITVTGFEALEINFIIEETKQKRKRREIAKHLISKCGDVWLIGPHRVACGDSPDGESYATIDRLIRYWQSCTGCEAIHAVTGNRFDEPPSSEASRG
jgi:hypothetical protein